MRLLTCSLKSDQSTTFACEFSKLFQVALSKLFPVNIYLFSVNNTNSRKMCEICSKLTIKTPERRQWHRCGVFIVNFEHATPFSSVSIVDFKQLHVSLTVFFALDRFLLLFLFPVFMNLFHATDLFLCPLKTAENQTFSDIFSGHIKIPVAWNWSYSGISKKRTPGLKKVAAL